MTTKDSTITKSKRSTRSFRGKSRFTSTSSRRRKTNSRNSTRRRLRLSSSNLTSREGLPRALSNQSCLTKNESPKRKQRRWQPRDFSLYLQARCHPKSFRAPPVPKSSRPSLIVRIIIKHWRKRLRITRDLSTPMSPSVSSFALLQTKMRGFATRMTKCLCRSSHLRRPSLMKSRRIS